MKKKSKFREYAEALIIAGLVAFVVRAFVVEAFKIPSGSMIPTLSIGDHIFVNKFAYGVRVPFTKYRLIDHGVPHHGDVIVFIYPEDESLDYIKRVIGLPGDKITLRGSEVYLNGQQLQRKKLEVSQALSSKRVLELKNGDIRRIPYVSGWNDFDFYEEYFDGKKYVVQYEKYVGREEREITVPEGHLFVMGDNRDNSRDSREWGFVPIENLKGKALFVWLSLDRDQGGIRWHEFGRMIR